MKRYLLSFLLVWLGLSAVAQQIKRAEYFWDADPFPASPTQIPITPDSNVVKSFVANTAGLTPGFHTLYIRSVSTSGVSQLAAFPVEISTVNEGRKVVAGEYFFNSDPGFGAGTAINVANPDSLLSLNFKDALAALPQGFHNLFIRVKDNNRSWSQTSLFVVEKRGLVDSNKVLGVEYFFTSDPGIGFGPKRYFLNPKADGNQEIFLPRAQPSGFDTLVIRTFDANSNPTNYSQTQMLPKNYQQTPLVNGDLSLKNDTICSGQSSDSVKIINEPFALAGNISYQWYRANGAVAAPTGNNPVQTGWTSIGGANQAILAPQTNITQSTSFACFITTGNGNIWINNSRKVIVSPKPTFNVSASGNAVCAGQSVSLTATGNASNFSWNNNVVNGQSFEPTQTQRYILTRTNGAGCIDTASVVITVNPIPAKPVITPNGPTTFCQGGTVALNSSSNSGNVWSTGANSNSISPTASGTFTVQAVALGCTSLVSEPIIVTVTSLPSTPTISSGPLTFCQGGSVTLKTTSPGSRIWSNNSTLDSLVVSQSDTFSVRVVVGQCTSLVSQSVIVLVNPIPAKPVITPNGPITFCQGGAVVLNSSSNSGNVWSTGANSNSISATVSGKYTVRVDSLGCSSVVSDTIIVKVDSLPPTPSISQSGNILIASNISGVSYQWLLGGNPITGATNDSLTATTSGSYSVRVATIPENCSSTSAALVFTGKGKDLQSQKVNIYPNPNSGTFNISSEGFQVGNQLEIFDAIGKVVHRQKLSSEKAVLNLTLPAGVYQLRIFSKDDRLYLEKLVIQ